jgi:hypothetical protein
MASWHGCLVWTQNATQRATGTRTLRYLGAVWGFHVFEALKSSLDLSSWGLWDSSTYCLLQGQVRAQGCRSSHSANTQQQPQPDLLRLRNWQPLTLPHCDSLAHHYIIEKDAGNRVTDLRSRCAMQHRISSNKVKHGQSLRPACPPECAH